MSSSKPSVSKSQTRSQATGRQLGRTALRAIRKNSEVVEKFCGLIASAGTADELESALSSEAMELGRVSAQRGAGRVEVLMPDRSTQSVRIAGNIAFHGKAGTKTDRDNCMVVGAHIVILGGQAAGRIPPSLVARIATKYTNLSVSVPRNYFTGASDDSDDDDGWEWDRSEGAKHEEEDSEDGEDVDVDAI